MKKRLCIMVGCLLFLGGFACRVIYDVACDYYGADQTIFPFLGDDPCWQDWRKMMITERHIQHWILWLEVYKNTFGDYPNSLSEDFLADEDLWERFMLGPGRERMKAKKSFVDGWGREFVYRRENCERYILFSTGMDEIRPEDDINVSALWSSWRIVYYDHTSILLNQTKTKGTGGQALEPGEQGDGSLDSDKIEEK